KNPTCAFPTEPSLQLTGGGCRCAGLLEVNWEGKWSRVCRDGASKVGMDDTCQRLGCGPPMAEPPQITFRDAKKPRTEPLRCRGTAATMANCSWAPANCTDHVVLACSEPVKTTPKPPPVPPATTPEPTGPPRLRLVDGNFRCSGFVELQKKGLWGSVEGNLDIPTKLATQICQHLGCGVAIDGQAVPEPGRSPLPVRWEVVERCESRQLLDCFNRTSTRRGKKPAFITCSGESSSLALSPDPGVLGGHELLSSPGEVGQPQGRGWLGWMPCCDPIPASPTPSIHPLLLLLSCLQRQNRKPPRRARGAGDYSRWHMGPAGGGGSRESVGSPSPCPSRPPPTRLCLPVSKKKQRQWIGPTGLNQTVSFHRNSTVTARPRAERQRAQGGGDNDYAQPPQKSSHLSAYPALEGARRASNPPDNSSDSDYDLQCARRV
ncbi:CD5 protein, partial [Trogon melanurus]|nr:CD5 protein [Trogon melanurus]